MPRVIIHRLAGAKKALDACRLIEALYASGRTVLVWLAQPARVQLFDEYLWTYSDASFVPHAVLSGGPEDRSEPVLIASGLPEAGDGSRVLVLLDGLADLRRAEGFEEVHDLLANTPEDSGRDALWAEAGFEVEEERGVGSTGGRG